LQPKRRCGSKGRALDHEPLGWGSYGVVSKSRQEVFLGLDDYAGRTTRVAAYCRTDPYDKVAKYTTIENDFTQPTLSRTLSLEKVEYEYTYLH